MDLSYEARWLNLRRQISEDIAVLRARANEAEDRGDAEGCDWITARTIGLSRAIAYMDEMDRVGANRA